MPGIFEHTALAEEVYRQVSSSVPLDKVKFIAGNLIPDLATADKKFSHYRMDASVKGLYVPDMERVEKELFDINDPIRLGMYSHLYSDYSFIEEFLIPEFIWDAVRMKIGNPRNNMEWDAEPFFMQDGNYYRGFMETNHLLVRDKYISMKTIEELPEILPDTGIKMFDMRYEKTWKAEIEESLRIKEMYTGNIFDYDHLKNWIQQTSAQLVQKINSRIG